MKTRIIRLDCDVYVIEEQVIPVSNHWASGSYITWSGSFKTYEKAEIYLKAVLRDEKHEKTN